MDIEEQFRANHREYNEIQTKTFTKWLNAKLRQDGLGSIIENVFVDLR